MLAILPPPAWHYYWQWLPVGAGVLVLWQLVRWSKQSRRTNNILWAGLALLVIAYIVGNLLHPIARIPSEYYKGKDQFGWVRQLGSPEAENRHEAVMALCEIVKTSKRSGIRSWIVGVLGDQGHEAKEALPVLIELLKDDDPILREQVMLAIKKIDPCVSEEILKQD